MSTKTFLLHPADPEAGTYSIESTEIQPHSISLLSAFEQKVLVLESTAMNGAAILLRIGTEEITIDARLLFRAVQTLQSN